jgi:photosystem II stability/assembly factor-like uncharacterized protein
MKYIILFSILFCLFSCQDSEIKIIPVENMGHPSSMRGLYMVDDNIIWASGTNGVVKRTINNEDWQSFQDTNWKHLDFRDIHAFSADEAIIMSSGDGCEMYKTSDGALTWELVYENKTQGVFFDGMDFWDDKNGIAFSDPINGKLFIIETNNGGESWNEIESIKLPNVLEGEAGFAASGTGIQCIGDSMVIIGTGGSQESRVFISQNRGKSWGVFNTKMRNGEASGIYSLTFLNDKKGFVVGGNYLDSTNSIGNYNYSEDGGISWQILEQGPKGYKSCISNNKNNFLIACGRTGIDISTDNGQTWKTISEKAYYSCVLGQNSGWFTGKNKLAKITF